MPTIESRTRTAQPANQSSPGRMPDWARLHPVPIIALGTPSQPVERMMGAQSTVYRLITMLEHVRVPRKLPSFRELIAPLLSKAARNEVPMR